MPNEATMNPSVLQLDWRNEGGIATVTPRDQDRYVVKVRTLVERLHKVGHIEAFEEKLTLLQKELASWLVDRTDVAKAFLTLRDGGLLFLIIKKNSDYNESLEDELTDLDIQLAKDRDLMPLSVDVLALPSVSDVAVSTFIDPDFTFSYVPVGDDAE